MSFIITELRITGPNVKPAVINLTAGLNIISGPSNTGKTYIFQCINYMLGGSTIPKKINEVVNYSNCYLEILTSDDRIVTLKSDLNKGDFHLYECAIDAISSNRSFTKLSRKNTEDNADNVSAYLLDLCNLQGKKLKINAKGKKRNLSFRDLAKLQLIDEVKIITDKSPIVTGQYTTETVEKSVLKLLITGIDDSDLIEQLSKDEIKHRKGKLEMLEELIKETDASLSALNIANYEKEQLGLVEKSIANFNQELTSLSEINDTLSQQKLTEFNSLSLVKFNRNELLGIEARSGILANQYNSDISRLESTIEACEILSSNTIDTSECPVCHSKITDGKIILYSEGILHACKKELQKINLLQTELVESTNLIKQEIERYNGEISKMELNILKLENDLRDRAENKITQIVETISDLTKVSDSLKRYNQLADRRREMVSVRDGIARTIIKKKGESESNDDSLSSFIFPLSQEIKDILKAIGFPQLTEVSFNEDKLDFLISGQDRELAGKGYRAITYSAFAIALHTIVRRNNFGLPVPILDSPLVTYRKPNANNEGISVDLAMDFYRYIAKSNLKQVLIMENEEPPEDIKAKINHIVFTQSSQGRYGFIPV
jgi:hypothetical protein